MPFVGDVEARWLVDDGADRKMKLLAPFAFDDSKGYRWQANTGEEVDGASIPEVVWSRLVGTPFIGDYRRASVIHDVACQRYIRSSRDAHRMFYEAMLEDGTEPQRAMLFYMAVRTFGPRWDEGDQPGAPKRFSIASEDSAPSFDEIEAALDQVLGE